NTPSSRASASTRVHSSSDSSSPKSARFMGFEQYGQCSGQRYVSSASRPYGLSIIGVCHRFHHLRFDQPLLNKPVEQVQHILIDRAAIARAQLGRDLCCPSL